MRKMLKEPQGFVLIAVVFAMIILSIMAVNGVIMFTNQTTTTLNVFTMSRSRGYTVTATEYVVKRLEKDTDWGVDPTTPEDSDWTGLDGSSHSFSMDGCNFDLTFDNAVQHSVDAHIKATFDAALLDTSNPFVQDNPAVVEHHNFTVWRMPKALKYGIFRAGGGMKTLDISNSDITGNIYNDGAVAFGTSDHTGTVFNKATLNLVPDDLPNLDLTLYRNLAVSIQAKIPNSACTSGTCIIPDGSSLTLSNGATYTTSSTELNSWCSSNDCNIQIGSGTGNVNIDGWGTIAAEANIVFYEESHIKVNPNVSGSDRVIVIAAGNVFKRTNAIGGTLELELGPDGNRVIMYADSDTSVSTLFGQNRNTQLNGSLIMARKGVRMGGVKAIDTIVVALDVGASSTCSTTGCSVLIEGSSSTRSFFSGAVISEDAVIVKGGSAITDNVFKGLVYAGGLHSSDQACLIETVEMHGVLLTRGLDDGTGSGLIADASFDYNPDLISVNWSTFFDMNDTDHIDVWVRPRSWTQEDNS